MRSRRKELPIIRDTWPETRSWTLVHSLYANMGGLLYINSGIFSNAGLRTHPATAHGIVEECRVEATCLLKDLVLKKEDIEGQKQGRLASKGYRHFANPLAHLERRGSGHYETSRHAA